MRIALGNQLSPTQNLMGNGMQASARNANTDPSFASVVLLALNESGPDGGTTFDDQSNSNHTLTASGNFQWDTAQAPTGLSSSGLADGTGDYLTVDDTTGDWDFGTGAFTIEAVVRYNGVEPTAPRAVISSGLAGSTASFWTLEGIAGNKLGFFNSAFSTVTPILSSTTTSWSNQWRYVAITRSGSDWAMFVDSATAEATASSVAACDSNGVAIIAAGWFAPGSRGINAHVAAVRVTKGVARTIAATPSLPWLNS